MELNDRQERVNSATPSLPETTGSEASEELAKLLWHRFAPEHHIEWEDEPHKAEYRSTAEDALKLIAVLASPLPTGTDYAGLVEATREVVRAAWNLCDNTANANPPEVPQEYWDGLSSALDKLEGLIPEREQPASAGHAVTMVLQALLTLQQSDKRRKDLLTRIYAWATRVLPEKLFREYLGILGDRSEYSELLTLHQKNKELEEENKAYRQLRRENRESLEQAIRRAEAAEAASSKVGD